MSRTLPLLLCISGLTLGCKDTRIVVAVLSDLAVPTAIDTIRIDVTGATSTDPLSIPLTATSEPDKTKLPVTLNLVPLGAQDATFTVKATGIFENREIVSQSARISFVPGQRMMHRLFLNSDCQEVPPCQEDYTCAAGACKQPIAIPTLQPYDPKQILSPLDAGTIVDSNRGSGGTGGTSNQDGARETSDATGVDARLISSGGRISETGGAKGTGGMVDSAVTSTGGTGGANGTGDRKWILTVKQSGNGTGQITRSPVGAPTESPNSWSYPVNTTVTLQAKTANGTDSYFAGWQEGGCPGAVSSCNITPNSNQTVTAAFALQTNNLVFVTSQMFLANLGGVAPYDGKCNALASAAGINNLTSNGYVAWISDSTSLASDRLGAARGWVRMDGRPFADTLNALLLKNEQYHPIKLDEYGYAPGYSYVWTGMKADGSLDPGYHCTDWSSNTGTATWGYARNGIGSWISVGAMPCDNAPAHLICMGRMKKAPLIPTTTPGKVLFVSSPNFSSGTGIAAAHALCNAEKPSGKKSAFRALLATSTTPASAYISAESVYVTVGGQLVATGATLLEFRDLDTGVWQHGDGSFAGKESLWVFTGSTSPTALATASSNCANWTSTSSTNQGITAMLAVPESSNYWNGVGGGGANCSDRISVYCIEQ